MHSRVGLTLIIGLMAPFVAVMPAACQEAPAARVKSDWPSSKSRGYAKDASAIQVLQSHKSVAGMKPWQDMEAHGTISFSREDSSVTHNMTLRVMGSDHYRLDVEGNSYDSISVAPHSAQIQMHGKEPSSFLPHNILGGYLALSRIREDLSNRNDVSLEDIGNVSTDGVNTHEIRMQTALVRGFTLNSGNPSEPPIPAVVSNIYIDNSSHHLIKIVTSTAAAGRHGAGLLVEDRFDDYRLVDGIMVPFKLTESVAGQVVYTIVLNDVKLNTNITETAFKL